VKKITGELLTLNEILTLHNISGRFLWGGRELDQTVPISVAGAECEDGPDLRNMTHGSIYYVS
tara:strand:+ start:205 stop:393 length:189 start_codon:yes stop_codon:yes gene_type:complete